MVTILNDNANTPDVSQFLTDFQEKADIFKGYCDQYMREEITIDAITRHLSEATAEAEMYFAEHSFNMSIEQLQQYGMIQQQLENMTFSMFQTEVARNKDVIHSAIKNGEYFIVNLSFKTVASTLHMMYVKQKIKTEQNKAMAELEEERSLAQGMIKVLKAIEANIKPDLVSESEYAKVQKAFTIYVRYFRDVEDQPVKSASNDRVISLLEEHLKHIQELHYGGDPESANNHIHACYAVLQEIADTEQLLRLQEITNSVRVT